MDRSQLAIIAANVKNVAELLTDPEMTEEGVERCAKTLHLSAQTLLLIIKP